MTSRYSNASRGSRAFRVFWALLAVLALVAAACGSDDESATDDVSSGDASGCPTGSGTGASEGENSAFFGPETIVFTADSERLEVLSVNPLDERTNSTPAVSDGRIFLRTYEALYCIEE